MERKTFVFHTEWADALKEQPDAVRLEVYEAVITYARTGEVPEMSGVAYMAFCFVKQKLDAVFLWYDELCERRREYGKKGGNPNFRKGCPNPYYRGNGITKDNQMVVEDNQGLLNTTKDNQEVITKDNQEVIKDNQEVIKDNQEVIKDNQEVIKDNQVVMNDDIANIAIKPIDNELLAPTLARTCAHASASAHDSITTTTTTTTTPNTRTGAHASAHTHEGGLQTPTSTTTGTTPQSGTGVSAETLTGKQVLAEAYADDNRAYLVARRSGMDPPTVALYADEFVAQVRVEGRTWRNMADMISNFASWLSIKKQYLKREQDATSNQSRADRADAVQRDNADYFAGKMARFLADH